MRQAAHLVQPGQLAGRFEVQWQQHLKEKKKAKAVCQRWQPQQAATSFENSNLEAPWLALPKGWTRWWTDCCCLKQQYLLKAEVPANQKETFQPYNISGNEKD